MNLGWASLTKDNDTQALKYFSQAYTEAKKQNDSLAEANAQLALGICTYGISFNEGMDYCLKSLKVFQLLEKSHLQKAKEGRSRCLQLISTIKSRQGKYRESILLSQQAQQNLVLANDSTGTLGLIYNLLGENYKKLNLLDSAYYFANAALTEHLLTNNLTYLPGAYAKLADLTLTKGDAEQSFVLLSKALRLAESTENKQAQVLALLGLSNWNKVAKSNYSQAEVLLLKAKKIAETLSDKSYYLKCLEQLKTLSHQLQKLPQEINYLQEIISTKDTLNEWEKLKLLKGLEIQFDLAEKENALQLLKKEKAIAQLNNRLLWLCLFFILFVFAGAVFFLKRINKRDKQLHFTKEQLVNAKEEQQRLKEISLQNEIEFKESQLSAMTIRLVQNSELLQELKQALENSNLLLNNKPLQLLLNKALNSDSDWENFNNSFESINKNFYEKLKSVLPDISPNELKICALIKMNLSIKEMADILNISPDSVKTARYRLRKKLPIKTEDNLAEFILNL